jgi:hypothetical protein
MDGYLTKPLEPEKLRELIAGLSTHSVSRNLAASVRSTADSEAEPLPVTGG